MWKLPMTTDRDLNKRAHAMLMQVMELPPEGRRSFLRETCGSDPALMAIVSNMVDAADRTGSFLSVPAIESTRVNIPSIPDAVGNYLIVGVLGTGGMATVYEAVQEHPKRRVALKVLHQNMTTAEGYSRFRFETEALARLHHPAIAQIYEAGAARLGQATSSPFFAMELVPDAQPITEFADRTGMGLTDRLRMFVQVCDAVHHGHQHGVIHRDLKPANVLVDGEGRPKVIDFGIARTTEARTDSPTLAPEFRQLMGTLHAMSPEQCDPSCDVDIRTDVYSLGVMLYQLVSGRRPHDFSNCSIPEAIRVISEVEPPRASLTCREAAGDLDAILAKSMNKDRERRYSSAAALGDDVRRFLAQLPIEARPISKLAQMGKFMRRNLPLTIASVTAISLMIVGTILSIRLAYVEIRARRAAEQRERQLETVTDFQASLLQDIDVTKMGDRLRQSLVESFTHSSETSSDQEPNPESSKELERLTDHVNFTTLAVRTLHESILKPYGESIRAKFSSEPVLQAELLQQFAGIMNSLGLHSQAEPVLREALNIRRTILGSDHADTLLTLHSLGSLMVTLGKYDEAIVALREAYDRRAAVFGKDHENTLRSGTSYGGALRRLGKLDEAERVWSDTLRDQRRVLGDDHPETLRSLNNMGVVYATQGRLDEAEACWLELLERRLRVQGENHSDYRTVLENLCALALERGKKEEALKLKPLLEKALAADRRQFGDLHSDTLYTMGQLGSLLSEAGDPAEAEPLLREYLTGSQTVLGSDNPATLLAMITLATNLLLQEKQTEARQMALAALEAQRRLLGDKHPDTIASIRLLSQVEHASGELAKAISLTQEGLELARAALPAGHPQIGELLAEYGAILCEANRHDEAFPFLHEGYNLLQAARGDDDEKTRGLALRLEECRQAVARSKGETPLEDAGVRGAK
jgi:eukaryotic-like serine/threonine-protein kinase